MRGTKKEAKAYKDIGSKEFEPSLNEFCNHCGKNVAFGSGKYVNRVPDCNDIDIRIENGLSFPLGDFVCGECHTNSFNKNYA